MSILQLSQVTIQFGGLTAVRNLDLKVEPGELFGLIGPNGAGKTTVFNLITGVYKPTSGNILLEDHPIHDLPPHEIAQKGISRTFQNIRLFDSMTVLENVMVSLHTSKDQTLLSVLLKDRRFLREEKRMAEEAHELLKLFKLDHLCDEHARNLPYGLQRKLEIARALATKPKVLLLDEPAAGMNPHESIEIMHLIHRVRNELKLSVLLVEHNMKVVMGVCERIQVIDHGESIAIGTPGEIKTHPQVIKAYLGGSAQ